MRCVRARRPCCLGSLEEQGGSCRSLLMRQAADSLVKSVCAEAECEPGLGDLSNRKGPCPRDVVRRLPNETQTTRVRMLAALLVRMHEANASALVRRSTVWWTTRTCCSSRRSCSVTTPQFDVGLLLSAATCSLMSSKYAAVAASDVTLHHSLS